jgi:hypothetical protein
MVVTPKGLDREHALTRVTARTRTWPARLRDRLVAGLASTEPRKSLQAWAEIAVLSVLADGGARLGEVHPTHVTVTLRGGRPVSVRTLAFTLSTDPLAEAASRRMLAGALAGMRGPARVEVAMRRCVPGAVDAERLRTVAQTWWEAGATRPLRIDDTALDVELVAFGASQGAPGVQVRGPWHTHRTLEALEPRLVHEALTHAASAAPQPLLLACVADPGWPMYALRGGGGWLRDLLYGPPRSGTGTGGQVEWRMDGQPAAALFRDRTLGDIAGVMFLDRVSAARARVRAHVNPWVGTPLAANDLPPCVSTFRPAESVHAHEGAPPAWPDSVRDNVGLRWYEGAVPEHEL